MKNVIVIHEKDFDDEEEIQFKLPQFTKVVLTIAFNSARNHFQNKLNNETSTHINT